MSFEKVYLTFKTDKATSKMLTYLAHKFNMTQPELIDEICKDFIDRMIKAAEEAQNNKNSLG